MGGKKKKGGGKKADNGKSQNKKAKKQAAKTTKNSGEGKSKTRCHFDIFNEHAMENAYFTCHNVQDLLLCRGFPWPDAQKKKKKKR